MNLVVLCTCPDPASAARIARTLIEERLAACVNTLPGVQSTYRWEGAVETARETLLLIKTTDAGYAALEARVIELHPYEVPEVIALGVDRGHAPYLDWLAAGVAGNAADANGS